MIDGGGEPFDGADGASSDPEGGLFEPDAGESDASQPDSSVLVDSSAPQDSSVEPDAEVEVDAGIGPDAEVKPAWFDCADTDGGAAQPSAPYLVYDVDGGTYARSMDRPCTPVCLSCSLPEATGQTVVARVDSARGGEVVISSARLTSAGFGIYARYVSRHLDDGLFELCGPSELQGDYVVSPDGRHVAIKGCFEDGGANGTSKIFRLDAEGPTQLPHEGVFDPSQPAGNIAVFSPDGRHLLSGRRSLMLSDLESDEPPIELHEVSATGNTPYSARFSSDSERIAFDVYKRTYTIHVSAAELGDAPVELSVSGLSEARLVAMPGEAAWLNVNDSARSQYVLVAFDEDGSELDRLTDMYVWGACGDVALARNAQETVLVYATDEGFDTFATDLTITGSSQFEFSSDCSIGAYEHAGDTLYFNVPPPDALPSDLVVHTIANEYFQKIVSTSSGPVVMTQAALGVGAPTNLRRDGSPPLATIYRPNQSTIAQDGSAVFWFDTLQGNDPLDPAHEVVLMRTALGSSAEVIYGPLLSPSAPAVSPDGTRLAFPATQVLSEDGEPTGLDGLVGLDRSDPQNPVARALLPEQAVVANRQTTSSRRIPGRRAVLMTQQTIPGAYDFYAVSVDEPAMPYLQTVATPKSYQGESVISHDGESLAVHNRLRGAHELALVSIRRQADDAVVHSAVVSDSDEYIEAILPGSSLLVRRDHGLLGMPSYALVRRDVVAGTTRSVVGPVANSEGLHVVKVVPTTGRIFVAICQTMTVCALYVDDPSDSAARYVMDVSLVGDALAIADSGGWLAHQTGTTGAPGPLTVSDEASDWTPTELESHSRVAKALFENERGEGLVVVESRVPNEVRVHLRAALDEPSVIDEIGPHERTVLVSGDGSTAMLLVGPAERQLWSIDLREAQPTITQHVTPGSGTQRFVTASWDGRYVMLGSGSLLDLETGLARYIGSFERAEFDRLSNFFAYAQGGHLFAIKLSELLAPELRIWREHYSERDAFYWVDD